MSQIPGGILSQLQLSGLEANDRAWQATTGAAIEAERVRAAHSWSADGLWTTLGKGAGEVFSLGLYDAGPRSGISAAYNFFADSGLPFSDMGIRTEQVGQLAGGTDSAGRQIVNRDEISTGMTSAIRRAARFNDRADPMFKPNEAIVALYGVDDQGQLFDEGTLAKMFNAKSEYELATRRAVALREREVAIRKGNWSPAANFAVSFSGGFTDPAMLASGMVAGRIGGAFSNAFVATEVAPGFVLPGTASAFRNLASRGIISGGENIAQGAVLSELAGQDYNWHDAARDMAFGSVFGVAFGTGEAGRQAAEIRTQARNYKQTLELLSAVEHGAALTERGAMFYQHVPGVTRTSTPIDIAAAEMAAIADIDHVERAGGGGSGFGWLVGRKVQMDGIGEVTVTGIKGRDVLGTIDGREVKMNAAGVSIDRYSPLEVGTRVRLDDGTVGTVETIKTESTPFAEATRVPRRGDATTTVRVLGDDGRVHNLNPDELLVRGGTATVRRGQVVFDPANSQRAVVAFGKARDASTLAHETGHVFRRTLNDIDPELAGKINDHYGQTTHDKWTVDAEERFARDFEQYMKDGKAPTKELTSTFERFAAWLFDLWQSIGGKKADLTDVQREAFGRLLDSDQSKAVNGELGGRYAATRDSLRQVLGDNPGSRATNSLMLANAKAWSRATGRNIDEYFNDVLAGFTNSLRNPFHAPIRMLPGRVIVAKGRPSGFINAYLDGTLSHMELPARAQREAQLLGLADPAAARAKWRAGLDQVARDTEALDQATSRMARMGLDQQLNALGMTVEQMKTESNRRLAERLAERIDKQIRERMKVVGIAIDADTSREAFTADRIAQINADIGTKARTWLFQNGSDVVKVDRNQRRQIVHHADGTITVNHDFVHMHAIDRVAAFSGPLMHLEMLRDAIDAGVRPDLAEMTSFIEAYGFDKQQADLHAISVHRLFKKLDNRIGKGNDIRLGDNPSKATLVPEAVSEAPIDTLPTDNAPSDPKASFSYDAIERRILDIGKYLAPETALDVATKKFNEAQGETNFYDETAIDFTFKVKNEGDGLPAEVLHALEGQPKYVRDQFTTSTKFGSGHDTMSNIGIDDMIEVAKEGTHSNTRLFYTKAANGKVKWVRRTVASSGEMQRQIGNAKDAIARSGDPNGMLLSFMHDNPAPIRNRTTLKPNEIGNQASFKINGEQFVVEDAKTEDGFRYRVMRSYGKKTGITIPIDYLDWVPVDAGTFRQGGNRRGPKGVTFERPTQAPADGAASVVEESHATAYEHPPEPSDAPYTPITENGTTLDTSNLVWNDFVGDWMDENGNIVGQSAGNPGELAQDVLDLSDTIKSEDRGGVLPTGGAKGSGQTGGRAVRVGAAPRIDRVGILKAMDHPTANVITNAIFQDPLLDSQGKRANNSAEQFDALHMHATVDGYLRKMHGHVNKAADAADIGRINIPKRIKFEQQFRDQVGKAVRDPSFTTADPNIKAAVDETRATLHKIGQLGKDNFVKNFDKFALDDNYLTRVWDFKKLHDINKTHSPQEVANLFEEAVHNERPYLTRAEARILGDALQKKLFTYGGEAGIEGAGFAAGLSNREYLLNTLKANGVDEATSLAIADKVAMDKANTGTLSVAKRRTLLNEKASITTAKGAKISIEDLLNNDSMAIVHKYGQQVISEAAMTQVRRQVGAKLGLQWSNDAAMMEYLAKDMRASGYSVPEINKAIYLIDSGIKRLRGISLDDSGAWTDNAWRVRQFSSIVGSGGFGIPAAFELGHAITRLGVRASLANMPAVLSAWKAMRKGDVNEPALKAMLYTIGIGHDTVSARYFGSWEHGADPYQTNPEGRLAAFDKGLAATGRAARFISGVPHVTEFSRLMAANGVQHKMVQQALSGKQPSARRLAWLGMDQARWDAVAAQIKANHKKGPGGLVDVQLDGGGWTDLQAKHDYIEAVRSSVNTIIQEGGIGASHPWLETEAGKVIFQFRQFGIMAYNRQTLAQAQIGDSEAFVRGMAAAVPIGAMQYMAATYLNSIGRDDRDEYLAKMMTPERMGIAAFSRASFSSIGPVIYDSFAATAGFETLGGFRSSGLESDPLLGNPTFSIITAGRRGIGGGIRSMIDPNYDLSDDNIRGIRTVVPFSRLPGTSILWNQILNQTPAKSINQVDAP